jgi:hypothetical protein
MTLSEASIETSLEDFEDGAYMPSFSSKAELIEQQIIEQEVVEFHKHWSKDRV